MSARAIPWLLAAVLAATCGTARADFYVATGGNDANPGTQQRPFQTIEHARDAVRQQIEHSTASQGPITVGIAAGTYRLEKTIELGSHDSGAAQAEVIYRAEPGAEVRLSGGRQIPPDAWKPAADPAVSNRLDPAARGKVLQADLKALGVTNLGGVPPGGTQANLYFNDRPLVLARWPNEGFVKVGELRGGHPINSWGLIGDSVGKFTYDGDRAQRWVDESDLWLFGYWFWDWSEDYHRVASIDTKTHTMAVRPPFHHYGYRKGQRYFALNALIELDSPGEWYVDRRSGTLYLWPPESVEKARIVFSTLESPLLRLKNVSHVRLRDLTIETTRGNGIEIDGGRNVCLAGCTIRNIGNTGVVLTEGRHNGLQSCDLYHIGDFAVRIKSGDRRTLSPAENYVVNCHIHHFAEAKQPYRGAVQLHGVGNRVAHCLIHDGPHMTIDFFLGNDCLMELNEIHDVCLETGDVGVFSTGRDWTARGNVIRYNFVHHVNGPGQEGTNGVYLDDNAAGMTVFGNVIYKTHRAILIGGGRDHTVENNLLLDCHESLQIDNRGMNWCGDSVGPGGVMRKLLAEMPYQTPPWSQRYPQLLTLLSDEPGTPKYDVVRNNVVWRSKPMNLAKEVVKFGTVTDNLTTNDDLGFQDVGRMDFRLRDDSIVLRKLPKFQKIPFEKIGLYVDECRKSLPAKRAAD
jgi:hypothetical protein